MDLICVLCFSSQPWHGWNTYVHIRSRYKIHSERSQASAGEKPKDRRKEIHILFVLFFMLQKDEKKRDSELKRIFWVHGTAQSVSILLAMERKKLRKKIHKSAKKKSYNIIAWCKNSVRNGNAQSCIWMFWCCASARVCCAANRTSKVQYTLLSWALDAVVLNCDFCAQMNWYSSQWIILKFFFSSFLLHSVNFLPWAKHDGFTLNQTPKWNEPRKERKKDIGNHIMNLYFVSVARVHFSRLFFLHVNM